MNLEQSIEYLDNLSQLEGSELGEAWDKLIYLNNYDYCFSKEFNKAVEKEIILQAKDAEQNFEIVEEEVKSYKRKVLRQKI